MFRTCTYFCCDETITTTPEHPFYVPQKGFVKAIKLRAGDQLYTVNGEYVVVEQIQHEIMESPVKVYNFRVADNHTYFVGEYGVGVHNTKDCVNTSDGSNEGGSYSHTQNLEGLNKIREHLTNDVDGLSYEPNIAMMDKIEDMLSNNQELIGAYKDFYEHELTESMLMKEGYSYDEVLYPRSYRK